MSIKKRVAGGGISLFLILFALDRLGKISALVMSFERVTFNQRTFSIIDDSPLSLIFLGILVALLGAWFLHELRTGASVSMTVAAAFITAGAFANFIDRVRYGAVIDWISIPGISVFNFADVWIMIGTVIVVFSFLKK